MAVLASTAQHDRDVITATAALSDSTSGVLTTLTPALYHSLHFARLVEQLLRTTAFFVMANAYYTSKICLVNFLFASRILTTNAFYASTIFIVNVMYALRLGTLTTWFLLRTTSRELYRRSEPVRAKIFFEFMVWILNPYAIALFVFWPGWIVVAVLWMVYTLYKS